MIFEPIVRAIYHLRSFSGGGSALAYGEFPRNIEHRAISCSQLVRFYANTMMRALLLLLLLLLLLPFASRKRN
jgi:hypothetical protein